METRKLEALGIDRGQLGCKDGATQAGEEGAAGKGQQFGGHVIDAHGLRHVLVFTHGHPRPTQMGFLQACRDEHGDEDEGNDHIVEHLLGPKFDRSNDRMRDELYSLRATEPRPQPVR